MKTIRGVLVIGAIPFVLSLTVLVFLTFDYHVSEQPTDKLFIYKFRADFQISDNVDSASSRRMQRQSSVTDSDWIKFFSFVPHRLLDCEDLFTDRNKSSSYPEPYRSLISEHETVIANYTMEEGYSYQSVEENMVMFELARLPFVRTICETGFNAGHSSLLWLAANSNTNLYTFDLGEHRYSRPIARWFMEKFPGRFNILWGHSEITLPRFRHRYPLIKCDLMIIDGGHFYQPALADFENFYRMSAADNIVLMDDYPVNIDRCMQQLGKVWEEGKRTGKVSEIFNCEHKNGSKPGVELLKGFSVGRFNVI